MEFVVVVTSVHAGPIHKRDLFGPFEDKALAVSFIEALKKASTPDFEFSVQRLRQPEEVL